MLKIVLEHGLEPWSPSNLETQFGDLKIWDLKVHSIWLFTVTLLRNTCTPLLCIFASNWQAYGDPFHLEPLDNTALKKAQIGL